MAVANPQPIVRFTVDGPPVPWERPGAYPDVNGEGKPTVRFYARSAKKSPLPAYKEAIQKLANAHRMRLKDWPAAGAYEVDLLFVCPRDWAPKGTLPPRGPRAWMADKPDADNFTKGVLDALNKILWKDDRQACDLRVVKVYAASDERPHTVVAVRPKGDILPGLDTMF